jgi:organic hydroperoxide reductase OsmC/OhrA
VQSRSRPAFRAQDVRRSARSVLPAAQVCYLSPRTREVAMSEHKATVRWQNSGPDFLRGKFSRAHTWSFDGGVTVPASASPDVVRAPYSDPAAIDPEEAFVASLCSCHMLTFVWLASRRGFEVASYEDTAVGTMTMNERGARWVSTVVLHPSIEYSGQGPTAEEEALLHEQAHRECFIANSVLTAVRVER